MHTYMHTHARTHACTHARTCMRACVHVCVCACVCACVCVFAIHPPSLPPFLSTLPSHLPPFLPPTLSRIQSTQVYVKFLCVFSYVSSTILFHNCDTPIFVLLINCDWNIVNVVFRRKSIDTSAVFVKSWLINMYMFTPQHT